MLFARISRKKDTKLFIKNDVWPWCLNNVTEFVYNWVIIKDIVQWGRFVQCMEWLLDSSRDGFCYFFGIRENYTSSMMESMRACCVLIGTIIMVLYIITNIVSWMPLVYYVQTNILKIIHNVRELALRFFIKQFINAYNENYCPSTEENLINFWQFKAKIKEFIVKMCLNFTSLFLIIHFFNNFKIRDLLSPFLVSIASKSSMYMTISIGTCM